MSDRPEALRLADALDQRHGKESFEGYAAALLREQRAEIERLRAQTQQEPVAWLRVIDEAMVTHHLGVADPADDYDTAKRKMNSLLCCAQDIGAYFASVPQRPAPEPVSNTTTLRAMLECCLSWEPNACVLGNVTARQAVIALRAALAQPVQEPVQVQRNYLVIKNEFYGDPPAPHATWGAAMAAMLDAGVIKGLTISARGEK